MNLWASCFMFFHVIIPVLWINECPFKESQFSLLRCTWKCDRNDRGFTTAACMYSCTVWNNVSLEHCLKHIFYYNNKNHNLSSFRMVTRNHILWKISYLLGVEIMNAANYIILFSLDVVLNPLPDQCTNIVTEL